MEKFTACNLQRGKVQAFSTAMDVEATRKLLADQPHGEAKKIAEATGLSRAWLSRFATGKIADPSASRLQRLRDHLSGQLGQ